MAKPKRVREDRRVVDVREPADPTLPLPSTSDPDIFAEEEHRPPEDGGVAQHPIHDSDTDDRTPEHFERESRRRSEIVPDLLPKASKGKVPSER
jgi:hypothetical protein